MLEWLMYKFIGLAMLSIFAMMVIPGNFDTAQNELVLYGMANMVKHDALGNEVFQQTVHNQLTDEGEQYILAAVFANGVEPLADAQSFGAICVSDAVVPSSPSAREGHTASAFDTANGLNDTTNLTCEEDSGTNIGITGGVATIGPFQFASGGDNVDDNDFIQSIAICQEDPQNSPGAFGFIDCQLGSSGAGLMLAVIGVTNTTLAALETVDITYTFDISSPND